MHEFVDGRFVAKLQCPASGGKRGGTDEDRMRLRLEKFNLDYVKAGKIRRIRNIGGCSRTFPPSWLVETMSTLDYVKAYYRANAGVWSSVGPSDKWVSLQLEFFEPLSDRITIPEGADSCEPWDGN